MLQVVYDLYERNCFVTTKASAPGGARTEQVSGLPNHPVHCCSCQAQAEELPLAVVPPWIAAHCSRLLARMCCPTVAAPRNPSTHLPRQGRPCGR